MHEAREQVMAFMRTQALDRKKEIHGQDADESDRKDIFTMLIRANETEEGKLQLDDDELVRTCSAYLHSVN
jgi:cytochrome P450